MSTTAVQLQHRNARLFLVYSFGLGVSWAMANLALNLLLDAQGVDNAAIGYYNALLVAGTIAIALPLGFLSGRLGRRRVLIGATATTPVALLILILAPPGPPQMLGAFLLGASESIYFTVGYPHMAENAPAEARLRLYSRSAFLYYAGMFAGYVTSSGLASGIRMVQPDSSDVLVMQLVLGSAALAATSSLAPLVRTGAPAYEDTEPAKRGHAGAAPRATGFLAVYSLAGLGTGALTPFIQLFLTQRYAMQVSLVGVLLGGAQLVTAAGTLLSDRVARRLGSPGALLATQLLVIPFVAGVAYVHLLPVVAVGLVARGLLADMQEPILNGQVMARVTPERRPAAATANQAVWLVGMMLGSAASGVLQEHWGWDAAFSISVLCAVALSVLFARSAIRERVAARYA